MTRKAKKPPGANPPQKKRCPNPTRCWAILCVVVVVVGGGRFLSGLDRLPIATTALPGAQAQAQGEPEGANQTLVVLLNLKGAGPTHGVSPVSLDINFIKAASAMIAKTKPGVNVVLGYHLDDKRCPWELIQRDFEADAVEVLKDRGTVHAIGGVHQGVLWLRHVLNGTTEAVVLLEDHGNARGFVMGGHTFHPDHMARALPDTIRKLYIVCDACHGNVWDAEFSPPPSVKAYGSCGSRYKGLGVSDRSNPVGMVTSIVFSEALWEGRQVGGGIRPEDVASGRVAEHLLHHTIASMERKWDSMFRKMLRQRRVVVEEGKAVPKEWAEAAREAVLVHRRDNSSLQGWEALQGVSKYSRAKAHNALVAFFEVNAEFSTEVLAASGIPAWVRSVFHPAKPPSPKHLLLHSAVSSGEGGEEGEEEEEGVDYEAHYKAVRFVVEFSFDPEFIPDLEREELSVYYDMLNPGDLGAYPEAQLKQAAKAIVKEGRREVMRGLRAAM